MDMEKVKAFAVRILEECEQEGLTVAEAQMIPQELRFALERRILEIHEHTAVTRPQTANKAVIKVFILVCKPFAVFRGCG